MIGFGSAFLVAAAIFVLLGILKMRSIGAKKRELSMANGGYLPQGINNLIVDLSGY